MTTQREPVLRARVDDVTKARFEEICRRFGETASDRMRQLVEEFVRKNERASDRVDVRIERPSAYEHGAWRITVALNSPQFGTWQGVPVTFAIPTLPHRNIVVSDPEYRAAVLDMDSQRPVIGGKFHDGLWRADVYSNGVFEDDNPTSIDAIKDAIAKQIEETLARFHGK
jgi:hypothetical protein